MTKIIKIGIIGTRQRNTPSDMNTTIDKFFEVIEKLSAKGDYIFHIVSGGCKSGADSFAEEIAKIGFSITIHYPEKHKVNTEILTDFEIKRKYAEINFARNTLIANDSDILIAMLPKDGKKSGGTEDTIKKYEKRTGKKAIII